MFNSGARLETESHRGSRTGKSVSSAGKKTASKHLKNFTQHA
jgi:hypothetical protein